MFLYFFFGFYIYIFIFVVAVMVVKVCKFGFLIIRIIVLQKPVDTDNYSTGDLSTDVAK